MRHRKQWLAGLASLVFFLAPIAATAHACATESRSSQRSVQPAPDRHTAMATHCTSKAGEAVSTPDLCVVRCQTGHQVGTQPQVMSASIALPPPLILSLPDTRVRTAEKLSSLRALGAVRSGPILFCRLLIWTTRDMDATGCVGCLGANPSG